MKKIIAVIAAVFISVLSPVRIAQAATPFVEPVKMRVTCYTPTGRPTFTGVMPFKGGCAAKREWVGGAAVLYTLDGEYLGVWDINDTGGHERITSGQSIDLFMPTLEEAKEWIATYGDYLLVQVFPESEG